MNPKAEYGCTTLLKGALAACLLGLVSVVCGGDSIGILQGAALLDQDAYVLGWTAAPMASEGAGFRTDGTLLYAYSMNGGTVNGIPFEPIAYTGFTSASNVGVSPLFDGTKAYGAEDQTGDFGNMLNNCWYWNQPSSGNTANYENSYTVTLRGLEAGKTYLVQLLAHRRYVGSKDLSIGVGDAEVIIGYANNSADNSGPNGEFYYGGVVTGIIKATDTTQDITVKFNGEGACKRVLNAIQVRELPVEAEPAKMFYIGETGYDSWDDLAKVLKSGDTVRLGTDAETPSAKPVSFTIDLCGHSLTIGGGWWYNSYTVVDTGASAGAGRIAFSIYGLNVEGGNFDFSALNADQISGKLTKLSASTVQKFPRNMTLAEANSAIAAKSEGAMIVVKGVTYTWDGTNWTTETSVILPEATASETRERIQDAIDAAAIANPIGTVELGEGLFEIDAQLMVTGGVTLVGQGWEKTVLKQTATARVATVNDGAKIEGVTLTGGRMSASWEHAAGVRVFDGTISWCCISNNVHTGRNIYGGGVSFVKGTIDHSIVAYNQAGSFTSGGAGIGGHYDATTTQGPVVIDTCLVYGNVTDAKNVNNDGPGGQGGGIGFNGGQVDVTIRNTTIANNSANLTGGGLYFNTSNMKLVNTIVSGNLVGTEEDNVVGTAASGSSNNLIGTDPGFADAANDNYRLSAGSPAIDAGAGIGGRWTDLDGVTFATAPAIGCYGYGTPQEVIELTIPAVSNMSLASVAYDGKKAVQNEQGNWLIPANATVTVTFVAATGYELTGNPVQVTLGDDATQTLSVFPTATAITLPDDGVTLTKVSEYSFSIDGCGGIAYAGHDNLFYVLQDHDDSLSSKVHPLTLGIDMDTAAVTSQTLGTAFTPGSNKDSEGIVYDSASGKLWISDEYGPTIAEFGLDGTPTGRTAPVPEIFRTKVREGTSLESLALSPDGLTMWTTSEEALSCDGGLSSASVQTVVRLTKFTRATVETEWVAAGQWAYACDTCQSSLLSEHAYACCGVSGLCALPDGSLLVLEREVSTSTWGRCRIYRVTPAALSKATDVSSIPSLAETPYTGIVKGTKLVEIKGSSKDAIIVYEGITLGPKLNEGSYSVYLVSDGGATATRKIGIITVTAKTVNRICALKLSGLQEPGGDTEAWDVPGATGGINGKADGKGGKCVQFKSISLANGSLTVAFEAGKVDANGQTFGLICKDNLTDKTTYVINVTLTQADGGAATMGTLQGLTEKTQLFILGIGPAAK